MILSFIPVTLHGSCFFGRSVLYHSEVDSSVAEWKSSGPSRYISSPFLDICANQTWQSCCILYHGRVDSRILAGSLGHVVVLPFEKILFSVTNSAKSFVLSWRIFDLLRSASPAPREPLWWRPLERGTRWFSFQLCVLISLISRYLWSIRERVRLLWLWFEKRPEFVTHPYGGGAL